MKKIFTFLTAALFAASLWGTEVQIGSGTGVSDKVPSNFKSEYSVVELLYPNSMLSGLTSGNVITNIKFNLKQSATFTRKWKVYISLNSSYSSTGTTLDPASNLVYDGDVNVKNGWFDIELTSSFTYSPTTKTKALQVTIYDYTGSSASSFERSCYVTTTTNNQSAYKNSTSAMTPTSSISSGTALKVLPNITFVVAGGSTPTLEVSPSSVDFGFFDKTTETKSAEITITGENLTDGVTIAAEQGLSVEPTTLTKEAVMAVGGAKITVSSTAEFVSGRKITISSTGATSQTVTCSGTQGITIDDAADNTSVLAANDGQSVNIAFKRSFVADMYNTICLPISLGEAIVSTTFGYGCSLIELSSTSKDGDDIVLNFTEKNALEAGKPYFIKPTKDVVNPSFTNYVVSKNATTKSTTYADFIPVFSPTALESSKDILFLGVNNELFWPSAAGSLKGLRCYFQMKNGASAGAPVRMSIGRGTPTSNEALEDNAPAAIKRIENGQLIIERNGVRYNINGQIIK